MKTTELNKTESPYEVCFSIRVVKNFRGGLERSHIHKHMNISSEQFQTTFLCTTGAYCVILIFYYSSRFFQRPKKMFTKFLSDNAENL